MITKLPSRFTRVVVLPVIVATFVVPSIAGGAPILPDAIGGLKLWLKADDISNGAEPADGAAISRAARHDILQFSARVLAT